MVLVSLAIPALFYGEVETTVLAHREIRSDDERWLRRSRIADYEGRVLPPLALISATVFWPSASRRPLMATTLTPWRARQYRGRFADP